MLHAGAPHRRLFEEPVLLRFGPDDAHRPLRLERTAGRICFDEGLTHLLGVFGIHEKTIAFAA
jgi:hypothetical protein